MAMDEAAQLQQAINLLAVISKGRSDSAVQARKMLSLTSYQEDKNDLFETL